MKHIVRLYNFLGSFYFAIVLISLLAIMVTAGTFVESVTDSHRYASLFTYSSPAFTLILCGVFINILVSALKRWPFQRKHVGFLTTHLGLLMVLSGVIIKNIYGVQGSMGIAEGTGSNQIFISDTYTIHIEAKDPVNPEKIISQDFDVKQSFFSNNAKLEPVDGTINPRFSHINLELIKLNSNSSESLTTWIKGDFGYIAGLAPFPVHYDTGTGEIPISSRVKLFEHTPEIWDIYAIKTDDLNETIKRLYHQDTKLITKSKRNNKIVTEKFIESNNTHFDIDENGVIQSAFLTIENQSIPLMDRDIFTKDVLDIDDHIVHVESRPKIAFLQDEQSNTIVVAVDRYGYIFTKLFSAESINSMIVYDSGFGGYFAHLTLPFPAYPYSVEDLYQAKLHFLGKTLRNALYNKQTLSPPLDLFADACKKASCDFPQALINLLDNRVNTETSLVMSKINWDKIPPEEVNGSYWSQYIEKDIKQELKRGKTIESILEERNIPIKNMKANNDLINEITHQIFMISSQLPDAPLPKLLPLHTQTAMICSYMKYYGINLHNICPRFSSADDNKACLHEYLETNLINSKVNRLFPTLSQLALHQKGEVLKKLPETHPIKKEVFNLIKDRNIIENNFVMSEIPAEALLDDDFENTLLADNIMLETAITPSITPLPPTKKLESNSPSASLKIKINNSNQIITLAYDRFGTGIKWPIANGEYRVRFQPKFIEIPHRVRLHDARQINYPNSMQPFSYESDLIVSKNNSTNIKEVTVSMNNVYETSDGYRFYLSNISPGDPSRTQRVQLVVNYDPVKYILTYPGGICIAIGIFLLFWMRRKKASPIKTRFE
ncbi:MAG: hypothetical protein VX777_10740 [Chlamydiota bacterium]|nr:hypothetical protein [Chlamydiota bacterium]